MTFDVVACGVGGAAIVVFGALLSLSWPWTEDKERLLRYLGWIAALWLYFLIFVTVRNSVAAEAAADRYPTLVMVLALWGVAILGIVLRGIWRGAAVDEMGAQRRLAARMLLGQMILSVTLVVALAFLYSGVLATAALSSGFLFAIVATHALVHRRALRTALPTSLVLCVVLSNAFLAAASLLRWDIDMQNGTDWTVLTSMLEATGLVARQGGALGPEPGAMAQYDLALYLPVALSWIGILLAARLRSARARGAELRYTW
jgi:hypothetical protein